MRRRTPIIPRTVLGILTDQGVSLRAAAREIGLSAGYLSQCLNPQDKRHLSDHHAVKLHELYSIPLELLISAGGRPNPVNTSANNVSTRKHNCQALSKKNLHARKNSAKHDKGVLK